jgi:hypothetical protein
MVGAVGFAALPAFRIGSRPPRRWNRPLGVPTLIVAKPSMRTNSRRRASAGLYQRSAGASAAEGDGRAATFASNAGTVELECGYRAQPAAKPRQSGDEPSCEEW